MIRFERHDRIEQTLAHGLGYGKEGRSHRKDARKGIPTSRRTRPVLAKGATFCAKPAQQARLCQTNALGRSSEPFRLPVGSRVTESLHGGALPRTAGWRLG